MTIKVFPIILAGGSGTRLWPLSRKNFPKQFLCLNGQDSLLQQTVQRIQKLHCEQAIIVSNDAHYFICQEQLQAYSEPRFTYILEPCPRNTAAAIAAAAHYIKTIAGSDAVMLVLPSDHWIADQSAWQTAMDLGIDYAANQDAIITFGILPDSAKTGYGYIEAANLLSDGIYQVASFREKPDAETATSMIEQGCFYWNSGMFVCRAGVYLDELNQHAQDIATQTASAYSHSQHHHDYIRLNEDLFSQCRSESIDYAVMEKTTKAVIMPVNLQWSDLGCWTSVAEANNWDVHGNVLHGNVMAKESRNCLISSNHALVTTLGIQNQIIVATQDAVLVADKKYSQQVKELVNALSLNNQQLLEDHQRVIRPWGYFEILAEGTTFKVKRLMIKPGAKLSLQMHQHRAEHWVVVSGSAEVVNDQQIYRLSVNQSIYIPQRTLHRLSNTSNEPLYVIEVQSGHYLGEDDIERFDDIYHRTLVRC